MLLLSRESGTCISSHILTCILYVCVHCSCVKCVAFLMGSVCPHSTGLMLTTSLYNLATHARTLPDTALKICTLYIIIAVVCMLNVPFRECVFVDNDDILNDLLNNLKVWLCKSNVCAAITRINMILRANEGCSYHSCYLQSMNG